MFIFVMFESVKAVAIDVNATFPANSVPEDYQFPPFSYSYLTIALSPHITSAASACSYTQVAQRVFEAYTRLQHNDAHACCSKPNLFLAH
jgi:hypothetical protein